MKIAMISDFTYTVHFNKREQDIIRNWSELIERPVKMIIDELLEFGLSFFIRLMAGKD